MGDLLRRLVSNNPHVVKVTRGVLSRRGDRVRLVPDNFGPGRPVIELAPEAVREREPELEE